jgi:uncharacterized protein with von Willebrand factor type A (vWA) domain
MVEDDNVDFDAFIEFSDLGLEDYIHNLDWDIKAKKFPLTKHSSGDVQFFTNTKAEKIFSKVFKTYNYLTLDKQIKDNNDITERAVNQNNNSFNQKTVNQNNNSFNQKTVNEISSETFINEVIENETINEHFEIKIEEKMTNISDILNQQIQQSNSMTIEQITELEKNMKMVNNNFVNFTELNIIQEKTQEQNEKIKKELKEELKSQKDFFIDFLNS